MWSGKLLALLLLAAPAYGAQIKSGAEFLNIPVGARAVGMGNAYTALANDVTALHWNPAGLGLMTDREFGATHSQWLLDTQYNFVGFGIPSKRGTFAASVAVLSQEPEQARGADRQRTGSIKAQDQALSLGFGRNIGGFQAGANAKFIQSSIAGFSANTMALDMGLLVPMNRAVGLGFAVQNLGPGMKFVEQRDPLPLTFAAGVALRTLIPGMSLAFDMRQQPNNKKTNFSMGTEYQIMNMLSLRGGYLASLAGPGAARSSQSLSGMGAGFGLKVSGYQFDYSLTPFGALGDTHRLSLTARF